MGGGGSWDWIFLKDATVLGGEHGFPLQFTNIDLGKEKLKSQRENLKVIALFRLQDLQFSENMYKICSWEVLSF